MEKDEDEVARQRQTGNGEGGGGGREAEGGDGDVETVTEAGNGGAGTRGGSNGCGRDRCGGYGRGVDAEVIERAAMKATAIREFTRWRWWRRRWQ